MDTGTILVGLCLFTKLNTNYSVNLIWAKSAFPETGIPTLCTQNVFIWSW